MLTRRAEPLAKLTLPLHPREAWQPDPRRSETTWKAAPSRGWAGGQRESVRARVLRGIEGTRISAEQSSRDSRVRWRAGCLGPAGPRAKRDLSAPFQS